MKKIAIPLFISLYCAGAIAASDIFTDKLDGQFDASRYLSENAYGFLPVPVIITDPAVDGGLGMMGLFFHESEAEKDARLAAMQDESNDKAAHSLMPPSISAAFAAYTGNDSYLADAGHVGFFNQGSIRYKGGAGYGDIKLNSYGFGDLELPKPIEVNTKAVAVMQVLKFKLGDSNFYFGPLQRYINADISAGNLDNITDNIIGDIPDNYAIDLHSLLSTSITTSGAGLILEYDSRDSFFSPSQGFKYNFSYLWFDECIGSDIDYRLSEFSALNYFKLSDHWRTAIRVEANYADSDQILPSYATPSISMRGIPAARYQG